VKRVTLANAVLLGLYFAAGAEVESDALRRENAIRKAEAKMVGLKYCAAGHRGCSVAGVRRSMLNLTSSEIESILGPPQYHLRLGKQDLYYWTVPITENGVLKRVRLQVTYGNCYDRESSSAKKAVCEVTNY